MSSVLLLNATFEPLGFISWTRAICFVLDGSGELIEQAGDRVIRSTGGETFPLPAVVRLFKMVTRRRGVGRGVPYSRRNLSARDGGVCQVVGCERKGDTIDHVVPLSRGGETSFANTVLMCGRHNAEKGDLSLEYLGWKLKSKPRTPAYAVILADRAEHRPEWQRWITTA